MIPGDGDWIRERIGRLGASHMKTAMSFKKDGQPTAERKKLMMAIVAERLTDIMVSNYVTPAMQDGLTYEPLAKVAYMAATGADVIDCGVFHHPTIEFLSATPDGLVGNDGLLECKCPTTATFLEWVLAGVVPEEHRPQMIIQLLCTGRQWCDFAAFDPRMPEGKRLFIRRYEPTQEERVNVEGHAIQFLKETEALFQRVIEAEAA